MAKRFTQEVGERLASVEKRLNTLSSGNRLDHASLDGTTLYLKGDGELGRIGRQPDGSNGVHVVKVQPPPQLTAAILTVGEQAGTCLAEWDGNTFDGRRMPLIHGHTEIWAELVGDDWSPTVAPGDSAKRVGTIRDRTGGEVVVALPQAGTWAVWLRAMGADRETAGPWSPVATVEITPLVDTEAIEAELEDARDRITEADERLTAGQEALTGHLDNLNDVRLPALEQDITNAVSEATADIQDFEDRWDTQWDTTIPALKSRQDTLEGDITTGLQGAASDLQEFRDEWDANWEPGAFDELRNRADTLEGNLADGLTQAHNQAEALAEAARDEAVNIAASEAQSEYDRLQEIAERALSRAGDNVLEDPSFETDYWFDYFEGTGTRTYTPTTVHRTGDQAMEISDGANWYLNFDTLDVEEGQSWRLAIWYRTTGSPSMGSTRLVLRDQIGGSIMEESSSFEVSGNEFRRATLTYTVPPGVTTLAPALVPNFSGGQVIVDDVAFQEVGAAAEALRLAEVARQQAEAAHIAAGDAEDAAANAYDAASSKSTVHWSLSAPSGTADNSDDVWWKYELRNGRRVVIGQWFWDDGVWRETEIAEEWLPQVNIGTGTYGDMSGDRLTANTVHANKMLVGPRNIITDLDFSQVDAGSIEDGWGSYTGGWERHPVSWSDQQSHFTSITSGSESDSGNKFLHYGGSGPSRASLPCEPGERFKVRFQVVRYVGWSDDDDYRAQFRWVDSNGNGVDWSTFQFGSGYSNQSWVEFEALAPAGATRFYFRFAKYGSASGRRGVGNVSIQSMTGSDLIVQGAVKAEHVDSVSLTASEAFLDSAMVNLIQGRMANFDEALIGGALIKDNAISAGKLTVMPDGADFAPGPGGFEDLWTVGSNNAIVSASKDPSGAQLRVSPGGGAGNSTRTYGPWIRAQAGDTIYYRMYVGRTDSPDAALRVYFMYDGSVTSWDRVWEENASGWVEGVHTVSDGVESTVTLGFVTSGGTQGNYWIRYMDVRKQVKGVLIEPEGIKSPQVDTAELTASSAFLDNAMVNLIQGRMANFDEALIGGTLLKDNSIATRHLVVADATNFAPEPGEYEAAWSFVNARVVANISAFEGAAIALDNTATDNSQVRGPLLAVYPGDTIYVGAHIGWVGSAPTSGSVSLRMEWFEDADSSRETFATAASTSDASLWLEGTVTVPDYATHARFYIFTPSTSGNPGTRRIRSTKVRVQTGGELIVDGSINSAKVNTQEFFAAQAVIDEVWTNIVRSRLVESQGIITEDMIATGAITTPKLTVTEEMVGEVAKLIRIEAGSLASNDIESMRIVSSLIEATTYLIHDADGEVSVRLDGVANLIRGAIHAGVSDSTEVHLDYGTVTVTSASESEDEFIDTAHETPFLEFHTAHNHRITPKIWINEDTGMMVVGPGYRQDTDPFRGRVQVLGDLKANRLYSRQHRIDTGSNTTSAGLMASDAEPGRIRLQGRLASQRFGTDTIAVGLTSSSYDVSPGGSWRAGIAYWSPVSTGTLLPQVTFHTDVWTSDNFNIVGGGTSKRSQSGFTWNAGHIRGDNTATFWVTWSAHWI